MKKPFSFSLVIGVMLAAAVTNANIRGDVGGEELTIVWGSRPPIENSFTTGTYEYCSDLVCGYTVYNSFKVENESGEVDLTIDVQDSLLSKSASFYVENGEWYVLSIYIQFGYQGYEKAFTLSFNSPSSDNDDFYSITSYYNFVDLKEMKLEEFYSCEPPIVNMTGIWEITVTLIDSDCAGIIDIEESGEVTVEFTQRRNLISYMYGDVKGSICGDFFEFNEQSFPFQGGTLNSIDTGTVASDGKSFRGIETNRWSDGVSSCEWTRETYGDIDNDGDGFSDAEEIECGSDPADPSSTCNRGLPWLMLLLE